MTDRTLDDLIKRVLNDPDVFYVRNPIFNNAEWREIKNNYKRENPNAVIELIDKKIQNLGNEIKVTQDNKAREAIKDTISFTKSLKNFVHKSPYVFEQILTTLDRLGLTKCSLPNMEDYGKVIESHSRQTVEQFFLYKIDKAKGYEKKALIRIFEYLKELYDVNIDVLVIAFFIRKLNSFIQFVEVVKNE